MGWMERLWPSAHGAQRVEPTLNSRSFGSDFNSAFLSGSDWAPRTASGVRVTERTALSIAAVNACVSYISYDLAKLEVGHFQGSKKGGRIKVASPLSALLTRPAPWLTWFEFCSMLQSCVLLRGNGFAVILRDGRGKPVSMVPIHPDLVTLYEAPDGSLFYRVERRGNFHTATLAATPIYVPAEDMFHLKSLSSDGLMGMSPLSIERETFGLALAQSELAARWTGNGAQPRGILTTDQQLSDPIREKVAASWKELNGGLLNAGKTAIFEKGLKWSPLSMTAQDMEFLASRQYQNEEIARIYRMPLHMLADRNGGKASVVQQAQEYLNYTLSTWIRMWESRISLTFDIDESSTFVDFDEDTLLQADIQTRYAANRLSLGGQPWDTINHVRAQEGLPPIDGGDELYRPVNMAPLQSDEFEANNNIPDASGAGSEQTGVGADGGGRPKDNGAPAAPQGVKPK